jgi:hypothetical protein
VIAADPAAARKRKEEALREARVERWDESAGTAAWALEQTTPGVLIWSTPAGRHYPVTPA